MAFLTITVSVPIVQQQSVKIDNIWCYLDYLFNVHIFTIDISKKGAEEELYEENSFSLNGKNFVKI